MKRHAPVCGSREAYEWVLLWFQRADDMHFANGNLFGKFGSLVEHEIRHIVRLASLDAGRRIG